MNKKNYYEQLYKNKKYQGGFAPEEDPGAYLRFKLIFSLVEKFIKLHKNLKVLDIGYSRGAFLDFLPIKIENKFGVDISSLAVRSAKKKNLSCFQLDVESKKLPFKDDFF